MWPIHPEQLEKVWCRRLWPGGMESLGPAQDKLRPVPTRVAVPKVTAKNAGHDYSDFTIILI